MTNPERGMCVEGGCDRDCYPGCGRCRMHASECWCGRLRYRSDNACEKHCEKVGCKEEIVPGAEHCEDHVERCESCKEPLTESSDCTEYVCAHPRCNRCGDSFSGGECDEDGCKLTCGWGGECGYNGGDCPSNDCTYCWMHCRHGEDDQL